LPLRLLEGYGVRPEQLDERARALVRITPPVPADGHIGQLQSKNDAFGGGI